MSNKYITFLDDVFLQREASINNYTNVIVSGITQSGKTSFVFEYLKNHPEKRNFAAYFLINIALTKAWPCKKNNGKK